MFEFAHKKFIDQFWIQDQQLRLTVRKYTNKWRFTAELTINQTVNSNVMTLFHAFQHYLPINLILIINEVLQVNRRFSESTNKRPWNWSKNISITPIIEMPR